jgi:hypothetical protein
MSKYGKHRHSSTDCGEHSHHAPNHQSLPRGEFRALHMHQVEFLVILASPDQIRTKHNDKSHSPQLAKLPAYDLRSREPRRRHRDDARGRP